MNIQCLNGLMKIFVKRFIYALIIFFFTAQLLTGIILIYGKKLPLTIMKMRLGDYSSCFCSMPIYLGIK